jgi:hypothetical protein
MQMASPSDSKTQHCMASWRPRRSGTRCPRRTRPSAPSAASHCSTSPPCTRSPPTCWPRRKNFQPGTASWQRCRPGNSGLVYTSLARWACCNSCPARTRSARTSLCCSTCRPNTPRRRSSPWRGSMICTAKKRTDRKTAVKAKNRWEEKKNEGQTSSANKPDGADLRRGAGKGRASRA